MLGTGLEKIAMVLDADSDVVLFAMLGAFAQRGGDPVENGGSRRSIRNGLPGLGSHLRVGEDADHGHAGPGGDLDPLLNGSDSGGAGGVFGGVVRCIRGGWRLR